MLMEVLNHSLDLWVDVLPQLLCPCIYMGKPNNRPEVPTIVVDNLQVALPVLLHDPLVEELEHSDMPSTGNLHQDCVAVIRNQIRIGAPIEQFLDTVQLVTGLTTLGEPSLLADAGQDRGVRGPPAGRANI